MVPMLYNILKKLSLWLKTREPIFIENSKVPVVLSYVAPINIGAIAFGPFVWSRHEMTPRLKRHETIHFIQQLELLFIFQWALYVGFWLFNLIKYKNGSMAYYNIPFEREAYNHEHKEDYLLNRPVWNWRGYIKDETERF